MKQFISLLVLMLLFSGCSISDDSGQRAARLDQEVVEYCFNPQEEELRVADVQMTPEQYLLENEDANAVINGVYYARDDGKPLGVVEQNNDSYATGRGRVSAYFFITAKGRIGVDEERPDEQLSFAVGTHPLLVTPGGVHSQAREDRYNRFLDEDGNPVGKKKDVRSALGYKNQQTACFVASINAYTIEEWAEELQSRGYIGAINLDGGNPSQLAIRTGQKSSYFPQQSRVLFYTTH